MKKIKTYLANLVKLPVGVKWIFGINIAVCAVCLAAFNIFNVKLQNYLGLFPMYSDNFNPLQLITSMFTHSLGLPHIVYNMLFFLIFAPFVENKFGTKFFIISYFVCGFFGNVFITYNYYRIKPIIENSIESVGVDIKDIKVSDFLVDTSYISTLKPNQVSVVDDYNNVISKTYGASAALFGIVLIYLLFNITNIKKILYNILAIHLIYVVVNGFIYNSVITAGSDYSHVGGLFGGLLIYILFKTKKDIV